MEPASENKNNCIKVQLDRNSTSPTKAIAEVLHYKQVSQTRAMKDGFLREDGILSEYMKSKKLDNQNVIVKPCGRFVSKSHHFLAASPDALVYHVKFRWTC